MSNFEALRGELASFGGQKMKIYALICHKLVLTQLWLKVVSWRLEITTDELDMIVIKMPCEFDKAEFYSSFN